MKPGYFGGREEKQRDQERGAGRDPRVLPWPLSSLLENRDRHRYVFHFPDSSCLLSRGKVTARDLQDVFVSKNTSSDI